MAQQPADYVPINCEFHDLLEAAATSKARAQVVFRGADGHAQCRTATITDVFAQEGVEYLSLDTGETLRLDQLLQVDGEKLADY